MACVGGAPRTTTGDCPPCRTSAQTLPATTQKGNTVTDKLLLTVEEAADRLGIGRTLTYALVKSGEIESVQIGRLRRIPLAALDRFLDRLTGQSDRPAA